MKLRFRDNTLRLRVNRREVATLAAGSSLVEELLFPGGARLSYLLESRDKEFPLASFDGSAIRVTAPLSDLRSWAGGDSIGLYFDLPADGRTLKIAIEKDLECVDGPPEEHDPDAFPRASPSNC